MVPETRPTPELGCAGNETSNAGETFGAGKRERDWIYGDGRTWWEESVKG